MTRAVNQKAARTKGWTLSTACLLCYLPLAAQAQLSVCTVTPLPVSFGIVSPSDPGNSTGSGTITIACTGISLIPYTISLSTGSSGSYSPRLMTSGGHNMQYNLFSDAALTKVWGNGSGDSHTVSGSITLLVTSRLHPVYGAIPGNQNIAAGTYSDTVQITVSY